MYRKTIQTIMARGTPLRWRIVMVLLVASFLPLALAGIGTWVLFGDLLENKSLEVMRSIVQRHAQAIDADLSERLHLLQVVSESSTGADLGDVNHLRFLLENLNRASGGGYVDLGIIASDGRHVAYAGPYDLQKKNYRDADWFREVMAEGVYISDVFLGFREIPHCIIAVRTVRGHESWILRATINSEQFDALVRTRLPGESGDIYIVNRDGLYQTAPRGGSVLDRAMLEPIEFHRGVRDRRVTINDTVRLEVTSWLNDDRWMLVVMQDVAAVQAPVNRAMGQVALIVVLAVVLLVVTTFLATWHLTSLIDRANAQREEMSRAFIRSAKLASIGELATGLAHEINNPLAIISAEQTNIADVLGEACPDSPSRGLIKESVTRCQNQVRRCGNITRKMLQFGRRRESTPEATDLAPRLQDTMNLLRRQAGVRNIELVADIEDGLPRVQVDPVELEQVAVNLINNAFDAMPSGGTVTLRARRDGKTVRVDVADTGTGIEPEELERIFEPFFTTKPVGQGTGLGLSVCYGIVLSWGGRIWAESKPGRGTIMHLALPVKANT